MTLVDGRRTAEAVVCLGELNCVRHDLRGETPLFAAGLEFARESSGPIATAFLDMLPTEWQAGHLVIDSTLVWLPTGFRHGPMFWCHEPFPGRTDGEPGQSNLQRNAEHIACCCGQTGIEFLEGDAAQAESIHEPHAINRIRERHARLQSAIEGGRLAIRSLPAYMTFGYQWGSFHRHAVATTSDFHFWIRATRGDNRPLVNGIRNATNL